MHTPTPWWALGGAVYAGSMEENDPLTVADCDMDVRIDYDTVAVQNAAFIVKAANCHDDLVKALDDLVACTAPLTGGGEYMRDNPASRTAIGHARAILARAK